MMMMMMMMMMMVIISDILQVLQRTRLPVTLRRPSALITQLKLYAEYSFQFVCKCIIADVFSQL